MGDMASLPELTGAKLSEMAARRQASEVEIARDKVFALEVKLREADAAYRRNFPHGSTNERATADMLAISRLQEDLHWAKRRLEMIESAMRSAELRNAQLSEPEVSRTFEVVSDQAGK